MRMPYLRLHTISKEHNIEFERKFDGVFTTAEKLNPQNRAIIEEGLGPVYDCYGSREILR